jgi:uncharacterized Zn finger protein (UPF0148 family)
MTAARSACHLCGEPLRRRRFGSGERSCSTCAQEAMLQQQAEKRAEIHDGFKPFGSEHYARPQLLRKRHWGDRR